MLDAQWLPILIALPIAGALAGILAGLFGVGGGIVIVPVLFLIFQLLGISSATAMSVATGTSLLVIIATSLSSIRSHYARGNVDFDLLRFWAPFIVIGTAVGAWAAAYIGGLFASAVFGIVAILVAMNMLFRASAAPRWAQLPGRVAQSAIAIITGAVSVIMGIGGGTLGVPILTACSYPAHRAVGTAAAFGFIIAVPGALLMGLMASTPADAPMGTWGFLNLPGFALIAPLSVLMAPLGVRLGARLDGALLKQLFAVFLCISGARMIWQVLPF